MTERSRDQEAREALDRVARDSETIGSSSMNRVGRRLGDHFAGRDALNAGENGATDPIELWGRRIGRALSLIGVVVLAFWLAVQLRLV
jgi:tetrahydromethanopterin S-methyltransferase subunit G